MGRQDNVRDQPLPTVPSRTLFERVAEYLDGNGWRYRECSEGRYFSLSIQLDDVSVEIVIDVQEQEGWQRLLVYLLLPVRAPRHRWPSMLDAINRINHRLVCGNLEMNPEDGEIRVRATVEHGLDLGEEMIARALYASIAICEAYFPALMSVGWGDAEPAAVTAMVAWARSATLQ